MKERQERLYCRRKRHFCSIFLLGWPQDLYLRVHYRCAQLSWQRFQLFTQCFECTWIDKHCCFCTGTSNTSKIHFQKLAAVMSRQHPIPCNTYAFVMWQQRRIMVLFIRPGMLRFSRNPPLNRNFRSISPRNFDDPRFTIQYGIPTLSTHCIAFCYLLAPWPVFCVIKKSYQQYCATFICISVYLYVFCAFMWCAVICLYQLTTTTDYLIFTTYKWNVVNSNVMSFPALNSDFGGKFITRDAEVNMNLLITQSIYL